MRRARLVIPAVAIGLVIVSWTATARAATPTPTPAPTPASVSSPTPALSPPPGGVQLSPSVAPAAPTSPTTSVPPTGSGGGCGVLDMTCHVEHAIDGWFKDLVTSALNPVLDLLGRSVLATPDVGGVPRIAQLWNTSAGIADSVFVLLVIAGGMLVMGHDTLQTRYTIKDVAPRLVVAAVAANTSLAIAGLGVHFANAFSQAFLAGGVNPQDATSAMRQMVVSPLDGGGIFLILCGLVTAVLGVALLCVYIVRVALVLLLVAAAPVMLACHALPQTDGFARLWWRAMAACLGIQVAQSLVLIAALRVFFTPTGHSVLGLPSSGGLVDLLVAGCLLWVLLRIPAWASRLAFAGTGHRPSSALRLVKTAVVYKAIRAGIAAL